MRLDKFTAKALGLSRSQAREAIRAGRILLCGAVCRAPDARVPEGAAVACGETPLCAKEFVYLMLDKPKGVVSAAEDARDTTVVDLVREAFPRRNLFPAGRLDKTSTGFVLLTDDGAFAHDILAPGRHVEKVYTVLLDTPLTQEMISGFAAGVQLADGSRMLPALARPGGQGPRACASCGARPLAALCWTPPWAPAAGASSPRRNLRFCRPNVHETDKKLSHMPCIIGFQEGAGTPLQTPFSKIHNKRNCFLCKYVAKAGNIV